jgi:hypothetical protein
MENTLDIIIESMTDSEWQKLKLKVESMKAFQKVESFKKVRESAINFGEWILKHNLVISCDDEGSSCWVVPDGDGNTYSTLELYNIHMLGSWDDCDDCDEDDDEQD